MFRVGIWVIVYVARCGDDSDTVLHHHSILDNTNVVMVERLTITRAEKETTTARRSRKALQALPLPQSLCRVFLVLRAIPTCAVAA